MFNLIKEYIGLSLATILGKPILENIRKWYISPKPRCRPRSMGIRRLKAKPYYQKTINEKFGFGCCTESKWEFKSERD